jgi:hypothetical protein
MPVNSSLLYGEMLASWLAHLAIPLFVSIMLPYFVRGISTTIKMLIFIGVCCVISFLCQAGLLTVIQASSCAGINNVGYIFIGAAIAAVITGSALLIPAFVEPMRLMVSQFFIRHISLLTPELEAYQNKLVEMANEIAVNEDTEKLQEPHEPQKSQKSQKPQTGGGIKEAEYEDQTFQEFAVGASYWGAFAGAYGFGIGSLYAGRCK